MSDNEGSAHEEAPSPAPSIEHEPSASEAEEEEIAEIADNNEGDRGDIEMGIVETGRRSRKSSSSSSSSSSKSSHKKHKKHKRVIHRGGGNVKGGCWIVCIMITIFLGIGGFMIYKFFADTSFSFSSNSKSKNVVSTWSGDFNGEYTADVFSGEWSAKSDTRSMFSLAFRLAESEHKITIEKGPRPFDSYTVYTVDRIGSNKNSFTFSVGVPFTKSRPQDNASVLATVKIKGSEWKEKHEGRPKVEIKREFTDSAMKVTYTVDKAVYTKRFEKD